MYISALCAIALVFLPSLRHPQFLFNDPDLWWHLADARLLFETHHFIRVDPYSWTVAGHHWIDSEWLAELPFWAGYRFLGAFGIYLATWALLNVNTILAYLRGRRVVLAGPAFLAAVMATLLFTINDGPRTILAGYALLSVLLWLLESYETRRTRLIWLTPVIFVVWVNTHGTWLIGLFLFAVYWVSGYATITFGMLAQQKRDTATQKTLLTVLGLSVGALFLNPYGWRMISSPFDMMFRQPLNIATVIEWQPLGLESLVGRFATVAVGIMVIRAILKPRTWQAYEILWIGFAWYAAFDHARFAFLAGVVVAPYLAQDFQTFWRPQTGGDTLWLNVSFAIAAVCLMLVACPGPRQIAQIAKNGWPNKLIESICPSWRTFNEYRLGGQLALAGKPDFVDSRSDVFERAGVLNDYITAIHIVEPYRMLRKYRIDHILFKQTSPFGYLIAHSPNWKLVREEDGWALWARRQGGRRAH